ncbi:MAG: GntR family transcriptional regulator [Rhodospirillum sp.]|nr:GntR family transcriptional regulator [Rhodospirillum sp.]MCF8488568.1 GntR family transcriptional regulator [Rhodospirillum sp.]MCF8499164.1 GntR family transcriptional regulator [Rhodospirillum sp.]
MTNPDAIFRVDKVAAPLRHSVTESIRNAIAIGRFTAGERLPERELCELTGVSRTLVREALRQLESEGLIQVQPHRGPIVSRLTRTQAEGIYQVRVELEGLACRLFAENATDRQRGDLQLAFAALKQALEFGDSMERLKAKNAFYDRLIDGSSNEALGISLRMLNSRVMLLRATSLQAPGRSKESIRELSDLLDALMERDGEKAKRLGQHHVGKAAEAALHFLEDDEPAG